MTDHSETHQEFLDYTTARLGDPALAQRFESLKKHCEALFGRSQDLRDLKVLDVGCGMGVQAMIWAKDGHRVTGMDIDLTLLEVGRKCAEEEQLDIHWVQANVTELPFSDNSFDLCLSIELLEHVAEWEASLHQISQVLRPGGILLLTTTNKICPAQNEFRLPLYSWWPQFIKRRIEHLAVTTRPELANYTSFPAVNWFTFYGLRKKLRKMEFEVWDRIDAMDVASKTLPIRWLGICAQKITPLRALVYLLLKGTVLYARKVDQS